MWHDSVRIMALIPGRVFLLPFLGAFLCGEAGATVDKDRIDEVTQFLKTELARIDVEAKAHAIQLVKKSREQKPLESGVEEPLANLHVLASSTSAPGGIARDATSYDWCDCHSGLNSVTFWPRNDKSQSITVNMNSSRWVQWSDAVDWISWSCDGMQSSQRSHLNLAKEQWLSLLVYPEPKNGPLGIANTCGKPTGRLHWNTWTKTDFTSSIPFTTSTEGYDCFKIPALLRTAADTLIAFAEARSPGCSDYSNTDLVYKRSIDGGKTWGSLSVLQSISQEERLTLGLCGHPLVIGNIAPVQLAHTSKYPGRILAPHNRNNFETWLTHSDDDGKTWSKAVKLKNVGTPDSPPDCSRNMSYFGLNIDMLSVKNIGDFVNFAAHLCHEKNDPFKSPTWKEKLSGPWQWVGVGPPGSLQLKSGRVLIPCYHSYIRGLEGNGVVPVSQLYNNLGKGHVMISDDYGDSWRLGSDWPLGEGSDENQLVLLANGSVLSNSRSLATGSPERRVQARSDDEGETFTASTTIPIPQPFNGCQGSSVGASNPESFTGSNTVYVANPDPSPSNSVLQHAVDKLGCDIKLTGRERVSIWKSTDGGNSYPEKLLIDPGLSAQTSLQHHDGKIMLLYEQADPQPLGPKSAATEALLEDLVVLLPTRFVYREVQSFEQAVLLM